MDGSGRHRRLRAYYVIFSWSDYAGDCVILDIRRRSGYPWRPDSRFLASAILSRKHYKQGSQCTADLVAVSISASRRPLPLGKFFNEAHLQVQTDLPWAQIIDGVGCHRPSC